MDRRRSRVVLFAIISVAIAGCQTPFSGPIREDGGDAQVRRELIVSMIRTGQLKIEDASGAVTGGALTLPPDLASASIDGRIDIREGPLVVFFTTWVGSSPDPYCGYEYAPQPGSVQVDPLGSGTGDPAESIGDGWYWICAR